MVEYEKTSRGRQITVIETINVVVRKYDSSFLYGKKNYDGKLRWSDKRFKTIERSGPFLT